MMNEEYATGEKILSLFPAEFLFDRLQAAYRGTNKPIKVTARQVGRNDPCPCGSGKKFKKCCWLKTWKRNVIPCPICKQDITVEAYVEHMRNKHNRQEKNTDATPATS